MDREGRRQLASGDRDSPEALIAIGNRPQKHMRGVRIVKLDRDGIGTDESQRRLWESKPTVRRRRLRNVGAGIGNLGRLKTRPPSKPWLAPEVINQLHETTPTAASWRNPVEHDFAEITCRRIRRGVFHSVIGLQTATNAYIEWHNTDPGHFVLQIGPLEERLPIRIVPARWRRFDCDIVASYVFGGSTVAAIMSAPRSVNIFGKPDGFS